MPTLVDMEVPANPALDLTEIPRLEELAFTGVSLRYRTLRLLVWAVIQCGLTLMVLAPFILAILFPERDEFTEMEYGFWWVPIGLQAVLGLFWLTEEWLGFPRRGYAVRQRDITYRSGWFSRSTTTVPYAQIQHLELTQGPLARLFGLKHLKLFTAGGSGNLRIAGLEAAEADRLRTVLDTRTLD